MFLSTRQCLIISINQSINHPPLRVNPPEIFKTSEKKNSDMSTGAKVALGTTIAVGVAVAADYLFAKGKHVQNIVKYFKNNAQKSAISSAKTEAPKLETKAAQEAKLAAERAARELETKAAQEAKLAAEKAARELETKAALEAKLAAEKAAKETAAANAADCVTSQIKPFGKGKYQILVKDGKNTAVIGSCYQDSFYNVLYKEKPPIGYIKNGCIEGLYVNDINSSGGGMGTEAIKQAVKLSREIGQEGRVYLHASVINAQKGTPVPFYNKLGFKAFDCKFESEIEKGMQELAKTGKYTGPKDVLMYLPVDKIEKFLA